MKHSTVTSGVAIVLALVVSAGCSSDAESDFSGATQSTAASTSVAATTPSPDTTAVVATPAGSDVATTAPETSDTDSAADARTVVETLASDDMAGRNNGTAGSIAAQDFLIAQLSSVAEPLVAGATGPDAYRQSFDVGTNLLGLIRGSDLADQYVVIGAHYDHLGSDCRGTGASDNICNGASDNASGVAAALAVGRAIAGGGDRPRRSVIIALWDAEEDGLLGSAAYVASPAVPIGQTVGYVNFDMQGTNISPSLRNFTVLVGAETGGSALVDSARAATGASTLDTVMLSLLFGQGRSDHASFVNAGVPSVFFTDATPPCYHTVGDDASIVDFPKLDQQIATAEALTRDLTTSDAVPVFVADTPAATFADAVSIHDLLLAAQPDFNRFPEADRVTADQFVADLGAIVDAGADAFDDASVGALLGGTADIVDLWAEGECDGFLS
jgi:Peptidase family M28